MAGGVWRVTWHQLIQLQPSLRWRMGERGRGEHALKAEDPSICAFECCGAGGGFAYLFTHKLENASVAVPFRIVNEIVVSAIRDLNPFPSQFNFDWSFAFAFESDYDIIIALDVRTVMTNEGCSRVRRMFICDPSTLFTRDCASSGRDAVCVSCHHQSFEWGYRIRTSLWARQTFEHRDFINDGRISFDVNSMKRIAIYKGLMEIIRVGVSHLLVSRLVSHVRENMEIIFILMIWIRPLGQPSSSNLIMFVAVCLNVIKDLKEWQYG